MSKNEKLFGRVLACYSAFAGTRYFALVRRGSVDYTVSVSSSFADGNYSHLWFRRFRDGSYRQVKNPR